MRAEIDRVTAIFRLFKNVIPNVHSVITYAKERMFSQNSYNPCRTLTVNAELKNLADGSSIIQKFLFVLDFLAVLSKFFYCNQIAISTLVHGNVADIKFGKNYLDKFTCFEIITFEP